LANVVGDSLGLRAKARLGGNSDRGDSVEVLATDRDADDEVGEFGPPLCDGRLEGGDFGLEETVSPGSPEAKKEGCLFGDGSWDSLDGLVGRASTLLGSWLAWAKHG
jgi:hypothetical protein